jgi:dienelactone hydrolase
MVSIRSLILRTAAAALIAGIATAGSSIGARAETEPFAAKTRETAASFTSAGIKIDVDWFHATGAGRHPAILLLHGAGGFDGAPYAQTADNLAARGFDVFIIHYFERTGTVRGDGVPDGATEMRYFSTWRHTISDAVGWVSSRPSVDRRHVGILGVSLGASLALAEATQDRRVKAVVDYYGMLYDNVAAAAKTMAPVLILHGDEDPIVPVTAAARLEAFLQQERTPFEAQIYHGHGHGFWGDAEADADSRTAAFFARWLRVPTQQSAEVAASPAG